MNAFVAVPAVQHQPIVNSEKKTKKQRNSNISLHSFDSLTDIYWSPFMLCMDVIYFPYPKYGLRDHLSH